jgi:hypothetical protein
MGNSKCEVGNGKWEIGNSKCEVGNGKWEMGVHKEVIIAQMFYCDERGDG